MMLPVVLIVFAVAAATGWAAGFRPADAGPGLRSASWWLCVAGAILAVVTGALAVAGHPTRLAVDDSAGVAEGTAALVTDRLSGLFLVIAFGVAMPALVAAAADRRPRLPALIALTLIAVMLIITADQLFLLLLGWEGLTACFYLLTGFDRIRPGRARAAVLAGSFGKISGAALLLGGGLLAASSGSLLIADWGRADGAWHGAGYALLIAAFATKVGLLPVQLWLPPSYAAAPGPARAVMAGAAVNVGFYGMWRTLDTLGAAPVWLIVLVLVLAGTTAILGIAHASVHADLTYLIGWSSVENAGLIVAGFAVAMTGAAIGNGKLTAVGLIAGTAQVIAHAVAKTLLFVAAARVETTCATDDLDRLRGLARILPWSGAGLTVGALTLAGMPLTIGFTSEWFILESLMQQFRVSSLAVQLATALAGALVALTIGVAGVTFVRLVALTVYGSASRPARSRRPEPMSHRFAVAVLAMLCLALAAAAPLQIRFIAAGLDQVVDGNGRSALVSPWVLQPVFDQFSSLSPSWLWVVLPAFTALAAFLAWLLSGRRGRIRTVPAWSSGSVSVPKPGYTSFAYANPIRRVLANLLLTRRELARSQPDAPPADLEISAAPEGPRGAVGPAGFAYRVDVVEVVDRYLYRPLTTLLLAAARAAKRLQSGRLDAYLAYMMIALIAVLAVAVAAS